MHGSFHRTTAHPLVLLQKVVRGYDGRSSATITISIFAERHGSRRPRLRNRDRAPQRSPRRNNQASLRKSAHACMSVARRTNKSDLA